MNESLKKIVNHQIMNVSFYQDLGLLKGKTGMIVFFYNYSRHMNDILYEEFAGELLDEIYKDIHKETPVYFSNGLCGIGWAIEYLLQENYVEGKSDEILSVFDEQIMKYDPRRITDYSLATGLDGIAWYVLSRLKSSRDSGSSLPFDTRYLNDILHACKVCSQKSSYKGIESLINYMKNGIIEYSLNEVLSKIIVPFGDYHKDKYSWQRGIKLLQNEAYLHI